MPRISARARLKLLFKGVDFGIAFRADDYESQAAAPAILEQRLGRGNLLEGEARRRWLLAENEVTEA
jgi:hypothetical protein